MDVVTRFWKFVMSNSGTFILVLIPILSIILVDYTSLLAIWNQGRGGFLFAVTFLGIEIFDARSIISLRRGVLRRSLSILSVIITSAYFATTELVLHTWIWNLGESLDVPLLFSWIMVWDYAIFSIFILVFLSLSYGFSSLRHLASANVYLAGMTIILLLDSIFPFDSLGPLQAFVPIILMVNARLVELFALGQVSLMDNILTLYGSKGTFSFAVFWPSAGVHSMLIYSLIMLLFLIKLNTSKMRKFSYFVIGTIMTFIVNTIRIFLLSAYVLLVSTDPIRFEAFHAMAGEIVFLPWVMAYVLIVGWREGRYTSSDGAVITKSVEN